MCYLESFSEVWSKVNESNLHQIVTSLFSVSAERCPICTLTIQHNITSSLSNVGLQVICICLFFCFYAILWHLHLIVPAFCQVWMAALVLTDFILHKSSTSSDFNGITALELGAGTGDLNIILKLVAINCFTGIWKFSCLSSSL